MSEQLTIRDSAQSELAAIEVVYPRAFPDEDLLPVVRALLADDTDVLSLVAIVESQIAGHVAFTPCGISGQSATVSLLAPLAVISERQGQGIGSALVIAGLQRLVSNTVPVACVLGDPAFYGRLGFDAATSIQPPYPLPAEYAGAWQEQALTKPPSSISGTLQVPDVWRRPELWLP